MNQLKKVVVTREGADQLIQEQKCKITDSTDELQSVCYIECNRNSEEIIKHCRGLIFNNETIVMKGFPYADEYVGSEVEEIKRILTPFEDFSFYDAYEGALIRMFFFNGKWYVSTHRKIDASRSKWSSEESFKVKFCKALEQIFKENETLRSIHEKENYNDIIRVFEQTLNINNQYMFLVLNESDNRIVCNAPETPRVFHVGTFVNGETLSLTDDINIPHPVKHEFKDVEELIDFVTNRVDFKNMTGIIAFGPNNLQYKILNDEYQFLFEVRGNQPSINFRYLQLRMDLDKREALFELYPEKLEDFEQYESALHLISVKLYKEYVNRHIKKPREFNVLPAEEHYVIKCCHSWHLRNRTQNRISLERVKEEMNKQNPTALNRMIRTLKNGIVPKIKIEKKRLLQNTPNTSSLNTPKENSESVSA